MFYNLSECKRDWKVFQAWEAIFMPTHVQHLLLLHGIIVVTSLKLKSQRENDLKSCQREFIAFRENPKTEGLKNSLCVHVIQNLKKK